MKKVLLALLTFVLVVALAAGVFLGVNYYNADESRVPNVQIEAFGATLDYVEYRWSQPVLGGLMTRELARAPAPEGAAQLGELEQPKAAFSFPEGSQVFLTLASGSTRLYAGEPEGWQDELLSQPGEYTLDISCEFPQGEDKGAGYGSFGYALAFTVAQPPQPQEPEEPPVPEEAQFQPGRTQLEQGDIFAMQVLYLDEGVVPTATTSLGNAIFTPVENGYFAAVGIGNVREPGEYPVQVQAGQDSWEVTVTVLPYDFDTQDLIIDDTQPEIVEANSPKAIEEYNNVMIPMYQTYDEERYWEGLFIQPTQGRISTQFGEIRYTNYDYDNPRPHWGMDIAAATGTEVLAPNHGRVVFADYLLAVGWTVIIEHGGGLKSYYYHMSEINVEKEQMINKGELIGRVGTTGYSTGPHLHFEMRLGGREQVISPSMLFEENAGLYSVGTTFEDEADAGETPAA